MRKNKFEKEFERDISQLWAKKHDELMQFVRYRRGRKPKIAKMDKEERNRIIKKANDDVIFALKPFARKSFYRLVEDKSRRKRIPHLKKKGQTKLAKNQRLS